MSDKSAPIPILVSIPHASSKVPEEVAEYMALSDEELLGYKSASLKCFRAARIVVGLSEGIFG